MSTNPQSKRNGCRRCGTFARFSSLSAVLSAFLFAALLSSCSTFSKRAPEKGFVTLRVSRPQKQDVILQTTALLETVAPADRNAAIAAAVTRNPDNAPAIAYAAADSVGAGGAVETTRVTISALKNLSFEAIAPERVASLERPALADMSALIYGAALAAVPMESEGYEGIVALASADREVASMARSPSSEPSEGFGWPPPRSTFRVKVPQEHLSGVDLSAQLKESAEQLGALLNQRGYSGIVFLPISHIHLDPSNRRQGDGCIVLTECLKVSKDGTRDESRGSDQSTGFSWKSWFSGLVQFFDREGYYRVTAFVLVPEGTPIKPNRSEILPDTLFNLVKEGDSTTSSLGSDTTPVQREVHGLAYLYRQDTIREPATFEGDAGSLSRSDLIARFLPPVQIHE